MRISEKDWLAYIDKLSKLNKTAADKMRAYVKLHGLEDSQALIDYAYAVATKYGEGAAALSAEMYDTVAEISGKALPAAELAATPEYGEVAKTVNGTKKNTEVMANAIGRLVKRTGVDTTMKNAIRDGAEWAWIPHGDTCAFCLTLASRGWQKASAAALKGDHADHIHAHCDCTYAVRFNGKPGYAGYNPDKYYDMYKNAEGENSKDKINALRRQKYQENKDKINAQKRAAYAERKAETIGLAASAKSSAWINSLSADARDKYSEIIKRGTAPMQHGFSCFGDSPKDKALTIGASRITPQKGYFDVAMHGTSTAVGFGTETPNMGPRMLANIIKNNPNYNGEKIRLFCCRTGETDALQNWQMCFAEELSNNLGVIVEAPDDLLYINTDGSWYVGRLKNYELTPFYPNQRGRYK